MAELKHIGFVGYGMLACPMGKRLRNAGHEIFFFTPSGKSNDSLATSCASPEALTKECSVIILCVPNDKAIKKTVLKKNGLLTNMSKGNLLINMSSVSPKTNKKLAKACKRKQINFLECPVSGSVPEAETGQLVCLAGGKKKTLEEARPILEIISKKICHIGSIGTASSIKLIINSIMGAGTTCLAEGITYGLAVGLDRDILCSTLQEVAVISPHHKRKLNAAQQDNIPLQFATSLMCKDLKLFVKECLDYSVPIPTLANVAQTYEWNNRLFPKEDYSILLDNLPKAIMKAASKKKQ